MECSQLKPENVPSYAPTTAASVELRRESLDRRRRHERSRLVGGTIWSGTPALTGRPQAQREVWGCIAALCSRDKHVWLVRGR